MAETKFAPEVCIGCFSIVVFFLQKMRCLKNWRIICHSEVYIEYELRWIIDSTIYIIDCAQFFTIRFIGFIIRLDYEIKYELENIAHYAATYNNRYNWQSITSLSNSDLTNRYLDVKAAVRTRLDNRKGVLVKKCIV